MSAHVIRCRGCGHTWPDDGGPVLSFTEPGECGCTCTDDSDPHYEDWVVDPPETPVRLDTDGKRAGAADSVSSEVKAAPALAHNCRFEYCTAPTGECEHPE